MEFKFSDLVGKTIVSAGRSDGSDSEELYRIQCLDGHLSLVHHWDCCESVDLEDVVGDEADLAGVVLLAEEVSDADGEDKIEDGDYSQTWTFYKIQTAKGDVTLRFLGTSNGYYSERVDAEWHPLAS